MLDLTQTRPNRELLPVDLRPGEPGTTSSSRSWLRPVIGLSLLVLVLSVIIREGFKLDWAAAWHDVRHANLALLILAALVFATAAPLRALRWRWLLGATTRTLPTYPRLLAIWVQGWAGNCVTIAQFGDVWRATLLQQEAGVPRATTLGTIVVERLADLAVLTLLLLAATVTLVDARVTQVQTIGVVGFAVVVMAAVAVIVLVTDAMPVRSESEAARDFNWSAQRSWKVVNENRVNAVGSNPAYKLVPSASIPPLMDPETPRYLRAPVIGHTMWVTRHHDESAGRAAPSRRSRRPTTG